MTLEIDNSHPRRRHAPPGLTGGIPGRSLILFRREPLTFLQNLARDYGDVVRYSLAGQAITLINHPDLIRDVFVTNARLFHKGRGLKQAKRLLGNGLLTSEDEFHLRQRRLAQPAFHRQRIALMATMMTDCAANFQETWNDGDTCDIFAEMMRLTLLVVGRTLLSADLASDADEIHPALTEAISLFSFMMLPYSHWLEKIPFVSAPRRFAAAKARLDGVVYKLIAARRADGTDQGDLLSMLLAARDEATTAPMSDEQIRDEIMTIFIAGHETTAVALTWTWYLLAQHPEVERELHKELRIVLKGRTPTMTDLPLLPYTRRVLSEAMRLYPPAWIIGRTSLTDYDVGGYHIPAGSIVTVSPYVLHRDERFYDDPERFDPDRWLPERIEQRPKDSYIPFGGGPRICIGEQFAWTELTLVLATLAQNWRLRLVTPQAVALQPIVTLRPKGGIQMTLERR